MPTSSRMAETGETPYTRKNSLRLKDFDYARNKIYFVTIVVSERQKVFYNRELSQQTIDCLLKLREEMGFLLFGYCLMPDHFHALIAPDESGKTLGRICGAFKSASTHIYWKHGEGNLWQRGYHDHIIRNEEDFFECLKYIRENPIKKGLENWEFVGRVDYLR